MTREAPNHQHHHLLRLDNNSAAAAGVFSGKKLNYAREPLFSSQANCANSDVTTDHMDAEQDSASCSVPSSHDDPADWLQLGLGSDSRSKPRPDHIDQRPGPSRNVVELDLFSDSRLGKQPAPVPTLAHHQDWEIRQMPMPPPQAPQIFVAPSSSGFGFRQPDQFLWNFRQVSYSNPWGFSLPRATSGVLASAAGPGSNIPFFSSMKIMDPPPRQMNSGLWFVLQAEQNELTKELVLPQIPKSYLRIKDGKMTIVMLMKYLANKLRLNNEMEVEITCRGQRVSPSLTLLHVRDFIWRHSTQQQQFRLLEPLNSSSSSLYVAADSPTIEHVMILKYARIKP